MYSIAYTQLDPNASVMPNFWRENRVYRIHMHIHTKRISVYIKHKEQHVYCIYICMLIYTCDAWYFSYQYDIHKPLLYICMGAYIKHAIAYLIRIAFDVIFDEDFQNQCFFLSKMFYRLFSFDIYSILFCLGFSSAFFVFPFYCWILSFIWLNRLHHTFTLRCFDRCLT